MTPRELLAGLRDAGVVVTLINDRLEPTATMGLITPALLHLVSQHRDALVDFLASSPCPCCGQGYTEESGLCINCERHPVRV